MAKWTAPFVRWFESVKANQWALIALAPLANSRECRAYLSEPDIAHRASQIIPLKDRTDLWHPDEFWLWRLFAFELRRWGYAGVGQDLGRDGAPRVRPQMGR